MALDERYITDTTLEPLFVDKLTGLPLAGGLVYFWQDDQRNTPKPVYQLSGAPPNYIYQALPNPMVLNGVGTFQNAGQDNIAVYYYPYDDEGEVELYYVEVFSASNQDVPQFVREAWPNVVGSLDPTNNGGNGGFTNQLSNPQFVDILFDEVNGLSITYSGNSTTTQEIAPDWFLKITHGGGGTVNVTRSKITGTQNIETQPPYVLNIAAGSNITKLELYQRLPKNPNIWSSTSANNIGYIAGSVTVANSTSIKMYYAPSSTGTKQTILDQTNNSGAYKELKETRTLIIGDNPQLPGAVGYVDIILELPTSGTTRLTSVQVVGLDNPEQNVAYEQETVNRQQDHLFHYYNPLLQHKPIPSYLTGWNFGLNPRQFGDTVGPIATGANGSFYAWDQTIIFQTATNGIIASVDPDGGLRLTAQAPTQCAVIQYLGAQQANDILSGRCSVGIKGSSETLNNGIISLWVTTDANLPDIKSANFDSIVATLNADGSVATRNGTWTELTRKAGPGRFTFALSDSGTYLSGWEDNVATPIAGTATYFAIVVGFDAMVATDWINLDWVTLNAGDIATPPAPQTPDEVLRECQRYYEMSYETAAVVDTVTSVNALSFAQNSTLPSGGNTSLQPNGFSIAFNTAKRVNNPTLKLYSPANITGGGTVNVFSKGAGTANEDVAATNWTGVAGNKIYHFDTTADILGTPRSYSNITTPVVFSIRLHYVADARFGVVL